MSSSSVLTLARHYGRCWNTTARTHTLLVRYSHRGRFAPREQSRLLRAPLRRRAPTVPLRSAPKETPGRTFQTLSKKRKRRKSTLAPGHNNDSHNNSSNVFSAAGRIVGPKTASVRQLYRSFKSLLEQVLRQPRTVPIPRWITPKHYQFTISECFGHASFVLVAASYAVDDFLLLRMIAVAGSTSMLFFAYFHPHGRVLWLPFKWNVLFIAINSYRIGKVYWGRYQAQNMSQEFVELRRKSFFLMDPVDFYRLMRIGEVREYKKGDLVVAQGEGVRYVRFVLDGKLRVLRDGKLTYMLEEGNFISEAGIHAGLLLPGNIESCCALVADGGGNSSGVTRVLCWDRTELVHLLELHEEVRRSIKAILSWDIVRKLKAQRLLVTENRIKNPEAWTARRNEQTAHRYAGILHAILTKPQYLKRFQKQIAKYRNIHHIDDELHSLALSQCGWTVEEFEAGERKRRKNSDGVLLIGDDDYDLDDFVPDDDQEVIRDFRWYMHDVYLRFFS